MPLHGLQTHPPGLPDLRQGKRGPGDNSGLAPKAATLRNHSWEGCQGLLEERGKRQGGQLAARPAVDTWHGHGTLPFSFRRFSSIAPGLSFQKAGSRKKLTSSRAFGSDSAPWAQVLSLVLKNNLAPQHLSLSSCPLPAAVCSWRSVGLMKLLIRCPDSLCIPAVFVYL